MMSNNNKVTITNLTFKFDDGQQQRRRPRELLSSLQKVAAALFVIPETRKTTSGRLKRRECSHVYHNVRETEELENKNPGQSCAIVQAEKLLSRRERENLY